MRESSWNLLSIGSRPSKQGPGCIPDLTSQTHLHGINSLWTCMQISLWRQIGNRPMPLTSSVMRQSVSNFRLYCCSKKFQMLRKNVKSLLEQLQVCIFAEIVFGVRCTLRIISRVFSKFSQNCPSRETKRAIWKTLKIQVKLILNCTRTLAITCLSHTGQNFVHRTTFKVLPSRKQVCR